MSSNDTIIPCAYCGSVDGPRHRDHIVPHSRGGSDHARNCIVACANCNLTKGAKLPSEWRPEGLPDWIYKLETDLVERYRMPARVGRTNRSGDSWPCYFCAGPVRIDGGTVEICDQELPPFEKPPGTRFNRHGGREEYGRL